MKLLGLLQPPHDGVAQRHLGFTIECLYLGRVEVLFKLNRLLVTGDELSIGKVLFVEGSDLPCEAICLSL